MTAAAPPAAPTTAPAAVTPRRVAVLIAWAGAVWAAAQLRHAGALNDHSTCGVWGCGAPTGALAAVHAVWAVLLVPPAVFVTRRVVRRRGRAAAAGFGAALLLAGLLGAAAHAGWDLRRWLPGATEHQRTFAVQRGLFVAANQTDVPLLPLAAAGMFALLAAAVPPAAGGPDATRDDAPAGR